MERMSRRTVLGMMAATAAGLSACSSGAKPGGPGGAGGPGFSAWALTGGTSEKTFRQSFASWNAAHADAKITSEFFANDSFKEKIRTAIGSGKAPTLIYSWAGGGLKDYVSTGKVVDLSGKLSHLESRLLPGVVATGKVGGKLYAVPNNNAQPVVLYYNKDVLSRAGISAPPATFDDLLSAVDKLKSAGVSVPIALAGQSVWPELMWIEYLADRVGGPEAFQAVLDGKPGAWQNPDMIKALTLIRQLVDAGAFGSTYGSVVADSSADAALVHTGKAGMLLQGAWVYGTFLNDAPDFVRQGKLGVAGFPTVAGGKGDPKNIVGNPANFWSVSATASPEAQAAALRYLDEALFDDQYVGALVAGGSVPVTLDAEAKIKGSDQAEFLTFAYGMVKEAPSFQLSWDQALPAASAQTLLTHLSQVFLKKETPQQFADALAAAR